MFEATLKDREQSFASAPGTTMFLHWLVGMVYVFYFASFILLLREVGQGLQPGSGDRKRLTKCCSCAPRYSGQVFCGFCGT